MQHALVHKAKRLQRQSEPETKITKDSAQFAARAVLRAWGMGMMQAALAGIKSRLGSLAGPCPFQCSRVSAGRSLRWHLFQGAVSSKYRAHLRS